MRRFEEDIQLLAGSMIWVKNTAAKLAAAPLAAQAGADLLARLAEFRGASRIGVTPAHRARRFTLLAAMRYMASPADASARPSPRPIAERGRDSTADDLHRDLRGVPLEGKTAGVVFVADDLAAWLIGGLADAGRKKLTRLVLGSDQEGALQRATAAAIESTAAELDPSGK
jgi:hypothetical protein